MCGWVGLGTIDNSHKINIIHYCIIVRMYAGVCVGVWYVNEYGYCFMLQEVAMTADDAQKLASSMGVSEHNQY